ncbi:MAG: ABC transporter permease [Anaerolineae bacterium]
MNKTQLVLRYEILSIIGRKSFLFGALGVPLILSLLVLGISALRGDSSGSASGGSSGGGSNEFTLQVEGYVDHSGLITAVSKNIPQGILVPYADEASARQALKDGEITAYYVVPPDYVAQGDLIYVNPDYHIALNRGQAWVMNYTIFENLLGHDAERVERAGRPMEVHTRALSPATQSDDDNPLSYWIPYACMLLFTMVMAMSSGFLLDSVGKEKQNQVMEQLLLSISPRQLLTGKIIGLGVVGLGQTLVWGGIALALMRLQGQRVTIPAGFELSPLILAWAVVFFVLGYATYASLMAGLGALVPNLRDASQATIVVIWPLIVPMFLIGIISEQPHGALATGLSLFPLTAPSTMLTRLIAGGVPLWQPLLAIGLLALTAYFVVRAVARMFHAQHLLSGQPFSARRYFGAILGRTF